MSNKRVNPFKLKLHLLECEADEKDKKISDLEAKLAEMTKKYELARCPTGGLVDRVRNLEQQLAEKDKEIEKILKENEELAIKHNVYSYGDKIQQDKFYSITGEALELLINIQNQKAIEQLEKVLVLIHNAVNIDSPEYDLVGLYDGVCNQIKKLKGGE